VVKVRLQQACDAGVLAGRKFMTDMDPKTPLDTPAANQAQNFFANNFRSGWFKSNTVSFTPSKTSDSQVAGTATTTVPMTIMAMFGVSAKQINVTCQARYDVADADIMFVLDTTGSMACVGADSSCGMPVITYTRPDGTKGYYVQETSGSKLSGLRSAVLSFYDTLTANIDSQTHVRYGFVTYTSTVNVGYSLPSNYLVNTQWNYQTRHIIGDSTNGSASSSSTDKVALADCNVGTVRTPTTGYTTNGTASTVTTTWTAQTSNSKKPGTCTVSTQPLKPNWRYQQWPYDVSQFVTGASVPDPSKITGATSKWQGCVEERNTTASSSFDATNLPPDLDPDLAPVADVDANGLPTSKDTRWRPMWPDVVYYRGSNQSYVDYAGNSSNPYGDSTSTTQVGQYTNMLMVGVDGNHTKNIDAGYVSCGKPVQRLTTMARADVSNYVNASDFRAQGGTYHDTGMIWGTRFISPTGPFASDTAAWPGRQPPNRYIVFMTDGEMSPNYNVYGMYGMEYYDKRVTGSDGLGNDEDYHNARFVAECQAAKNRNITVFVVGFGQTLNDQLKACASPGQAYYASDNASLTTAFKAIANQVAQLRISK
jgi:uncharacterized protein YegL